MSVTTRRQREVLDIITRHIESHGFRPSYQMIARQVGVRARSGIARIVNDLETQGLLARHHEDGHFRIDLARHRGASGDGPFIDWLEIPNAGETREPWETYPIAVPEFMLGGHDPMELRAMLVDDDEMAGDGIFMDDVAIIELHKYPRDGKIVAALIENERAVLRKYYRAGADVELRPSEDGRKIIRISADRVEIVGVHRGLLRPLF